MGMTIEELVAENDKLKRQLAYESTALTMMKADYKARLKADMVAMLTEIQLEIEELKLDYPVGECEHPVLKIKTTAYQTKTTTEIKQNCVEIIQQKINALKGEE